MTVNNTLTSKPTMREVHKIVSHLQRSNPRRIILFGSLAKKTARRESDIDLCVLVDNQDQRPSFRIKQDLFRFLMEADYSFVVDLDFRVYTVSDFDRRLADGDPMVREIAQGRVIYSHE
jgi:predicted nucleotidyltransferase